MRGAAPFVFYDPSGDGRATGGRLRVRRKPPAFPAGLYGMLLFALCWLTLPGVFAPIERLLVGAACVVPRAWSGRRGGP